MPKIIALPLGFILLLLVLAGPGFNAALVDRTLAADMQEEKQSSGRKLSQDAGRACTESCITQCRSTYAACQKGNAKDSCRAEFQICARRCVVACGSK